MREKTPQQIKKSITSKKYYDKKRKPKKTEEEKAIIKEERRLKNLEYQKNYHKQNYVKKYVPKTEEFKKAKRIEYAKKYHSKINSNRIIKPRVKKEPKQSIIYKKEVIRQVNYVDNVELLYNIIISLGQGKLNSIALSMLMRIPERISQKFIYKSGRDREDIIQAGKLRLLESWHKFNSDKYTNCLAYYSELSKRAMAREFNILSGQNKIGSEIPKMISLSKWM